MDQYSGPEDIYNKLVDDVPEDSEWLFGLVAFAVVEEKKIEWIRHQKKHNGDEPTDDDIRNWYNQLPSGELLRAKDTAAARLRDYGETAIEAYQVDFENDLRESILVSEIRETKKFLPQFGVNLAGGFASALLFAACLTIFALLVFNDTSPVELVKNQVEDNTEVKAHD
ncbi:MAG: hypothetical protein ACI9N9_001093 [Enterobacterales bacterium]|jgi:hypothetical protein